ncbi:hypothetical protein D3C72_1552080 [compost metagenome]
MPPYSSITRAIWVRAACIRLRRSDASMDGGTKRIERTIPHSATVFDRSTRARSKSVLAGRTGFSAFSWAVRGPLRRLLRACFVT